MQVSSTTDRASVRSYPRRDARTAPVGARAFLQRERQGALCGAFNRKIPCHQYAAKDWAGITALTKEAVSTMLGFKLLHVGVNNASEEAAASDSAKFATLLGQDVKVGNSSMFVGSLIEMMKNPGRGTCGHIAIQTNYLTRAMYHLEKRGFVFDESSFKYDAKGNITVAYLKDEIAGFAVHFNQK